MADKSKTPKPVNMGKRRIDPTRTDQRLFLDKVPWWQRFTYRGDHRASVHIALLFLVAVGLVGVAGKPAEASTSTPITMVEEHVSGRYDVLLRRAIKFDDRFTMSRMVLGKCVPQRRCIVVRPSTHVARGTGWTEYSGVYREYSVITFHGTTLRSNTYWTRLFEHEIGHAFGLNHSSGCNLMRHSLTCHGHLVPATFTASQKRILRRY